MSNELSIVRKGYPENFNENRRIAPFATEFPQLRATSRIAAVTTLRERVPVVTIG
jgi:hypothetical protein